MKTFIPRSARYYYLLGEYEQYLQTIGYRRNTCAYMVSHVGEFMLFLEQSHVLCFAEINSQALTNYFGYLSSRRTRLGKTGLASLSIAHQIHALKTFFRFIQDSALESEVPDIPLSRKPRKFKPRNIITIEEAKLILKHCRNDLDRVIFACAYGCGMRRSEIVRLKPSDIDWKKHLILVREAKGNRSRTIPLSDTVLGILKRFWRKERHILDKLDNSFFVGLKGTSLNNHLKRVILRTKSSDLISKQITLHGLRHSIATHLIDNGAEFTFVQDFLGHKDPDSTNIYAVRRKRRIALIKMEALWN